MLIYTIYLYGYVGKHNFHFYLHTYILYSHQQSSKKSSRMMYDHTISVVIHHPEDLLLYSSILLFSGMDYFSIYNCYRAFINLYMLQDFL